MIPFYLSELARKAQGTLSGEDIEVASVTTDSRNCPPGSLFIALKGEKFDAHDFLEKAVLSGAAALGVSLGGNFSVPCVKCADTLRLLGLAGLLVREKCPAKIGAVTGSCGKTTVKEMAYSILKQGFNAMCTNGNFNNDVGVPLTLLRLDEKLDYAIIEQGASHKEDIKRTSEFVQADAAVITNVGQAHIEGFGSAYGVYKGKSEILDSVLARGGIGIVPSCSQWIDEWKKDYKEAFSQGKMLTFGFNDDDFVKVSEVKSSSQEVSFILTAKGQSEQIKLNLLGKHNAQNAAAAAALCLALGCDFKYIKPGLENTSSVKGRLQVKNFAGFTLIDDAYNASFNAVLSGIDTLNSFAGFKVMVFGDMGELGDEAVSLHEKVGLYAKNKINLLLCLGPLSRHSVEKAGSIARHFYSHDALTAFLKDEVLKRHDNAVILVKGSHAMRMDLITDKLIALSESKDNIK